jgi:hypothetical protein
MFIGHAIFMRIDCCIDRCPSFRQIRVTARKFPWKLFISTTLLHFSIIPVRQKSGRVSDVFPAGGYSVWDPPAWVDRLLMAKKCSQNRIFREHRHVDKPFFQKSQITRRMDWFPWYAHYFCELSALFFCLGLGPFGTGRAGNHGERTNEFL